jgi:hypothetical protein
MELKVIISVYAMSSSMFILFARSKNRVGILVSAMPLVFVESIEATTMQGT